MNTALIYPMFAMVLLTFVVAMKLLACRISAYRQRKITPGYFKAMLGETPPDEMINASRHFSNLFEMPVLFYAGCIVAMILPVTGSWVLVWAWAFVAFRIAHAWIHTGPNWIRPRMFSFLFGCAMVMALWIEILLSVR